MSKCILRAKGIYKAFKGVQALQGADLEIHEGEIHCLAGENGCGKSTLINIISGVYQRDGGELEINGKNYTKISPAEAIAEGVQVIFQDFAVFPNMTVKENIALSTMISRKSKRVNWKEIDRIAKEAISLLNVDLDIDQKVENISVADKQLVAICRALINNVKLLIMDEPTTALTKKEISSLFDAMFDLRKKGIAILFVSHKLDEVFEVCDKYTIMRDGKNVVSSISDKLDDATFSYYMTGRKFEKKTFVPSSEYTGAQAAIEAEAISKKGFFQDVSFRAFPGEIIGFCGLLGSGRRELALSLFGVVKPEKGKILIQGKEVSLDSVGKAIRERVGYVPEDRLTEGIFYERSIGDNISVVSLDDLSGAIGLIRKAEEKERVGKTVDELQIKTPNAEDPVFTLSGGNQQRVVLAKWLMKDMDILILNAPTVGVDIGSKYDIHEILMELAKQGKCVIVVSDDLGEVLKITNRIYVIKNGTIDCEVQTSEVDEKTLGDLISA